VFLGKAATETNVKSQDLSRKKILVFATHALLPGDLDGLTQPALAFSAPEVTELDEDGLLTLGEILSLDLDADLVVLSACNTGVGDGNGNEAISGLGRAFFYSGARALLVTMWPVETSSANKLTTELFRYQREDKYLSRAWALQKSIVKLIEDPGLKDDATGKIAASYAHPFFWAPFVIVGEGGSSIPEVSRN
jgi:CHAT domain-containing protein